MLDPGRVSYQWTLRQIGAFMDSRNGCRMTVVEVPDGFVLRYQNSKQESEQIVVHFPRQQLVSRDVQQERLRLQLEQRPDQEASDVGRPVKLPPARQGGYQDFMRALGYELDQTSVYNVALDELDEGLVVTYLFVDARHNFVPVKKMVFLTPDQRAIVLREAYARREHGAESSVAASGSTIFG